MISRALLRLIWLSLFGCGRRSVGRAGSAGGGLLLEGLLFAGFLDEGFAREANFVALDGKHLDHDLIAEFQFVAHVADAVFGDFADVEQAIGAGKEFDESAEFGEANDFAEVRFAHFGAGSDVADHLQGGIAAGTAGGEDVHGAVFVDVDLDAGLLDDGFDFLAARTDEVADFIGRNAELEEARRVRGNRRARFAERGVHGVQNFEAGFFRLREGFAHHRNADAGDLDVHLESGDAGARAGDFEVHVAVMIFGARDVGEDGVFIVVADDEAHGDARAGRLERNTGVHHGKRAAANGGHGRGAVGFENVADEAHGVRKFGFGRKEAGQSAFGEGAVADFTTAGSAIRFYFADAERRKIVVEHEALESVLREEKIEALMVFLGAEGEGGEGLRFAAREQGGAVNARKQSGLAGDFADLVELAAVGTAARVQNFVAENFFLESVIGALGESDFLFVVFGNGFDELGLQSVDEGVTFFFGMLFGVESVLEVGGDGLFQGRVDRIIERKRCDFDFFRFQLRVKFLDGGDDFLDLRVAEFKGFDDGFFADFERTGFDHHDGLFRSGDDDIHRAGFLFGDGGIGDELAVEQADANGGDGSRKGKIGAIGGGGGAGDGNDVGIVLAVGGENHGVDLRFIAPGFREERAHGAVGQAGDKNFAFGGTAFALEEAAWDFAGGVGVFAIVDGERQKVAVVRFAGHDGGVQHDGVAILGNDGAVGLFCHFTGFKNERATADFDRHLMRRRDVLIFCHK